MAPYVMFNVVMLSNGTICHFQCSYV